MSKRKIKIRSGGPLAERGKIFLKINNEDSKTLRKIAELNDAQGQKNQQDFLSGLAPQTTSGAVATQLTDTPAGQLQLLKQNMLTKLLSRQASNAIADYISNHYPGEMVEGINTYWTQGVSAQYEDILKKTPHVTPKPVSQQLTTYVTKVFLNYHMDVDTDEVNPDGTVNPGGAKAKRGRPPGPPPRNDAEVEAAKQAAKKEMDEMYAAHKTNLDAMSREAQLRMAERDEEVRARVEAELKGLVEATTAAKERYSMETEEVKQESLLIRAQAAHDREALAELWDEITRTHTNRRNAEIRLQDALDKLEGIVKHTQALEAERAALENQVKAMKEEGHMTKKELEDVHLEVFDTVSDLVGLEKEIKETRLVLQAKQGELVATQSAVDHTRALADAEEGSRRLALENQTQTFHQQQALLAQHAYALEHTGNEIAARQQAIQHADGILASMEQEAYARASYLQEQEKRIRMLTRNDLVNDGVDQQTPVVLAIMDAVGDDTQTAIEAAAARPPQQKRRKQKQTQNEGAHDASVLQAILNLYGMAKTDYEEGMENVARHLQAVAKTKDNSGTIRRVTLIAARKHRDKLTKIKDRIAGHWATLDDPSKRLDNGMDVTEALASVDAMLVHLMAKMAEATEIVSVSQVHELMDAVQEPTRRPKRRRDDEDMAAIEDAPLQITNGSGLSKRKLKHQIAQKEIVAGNDNPLLTKM